MVAAGEAGMLSDGGGVASAGSTVGGEMELPANVPRSTAAAINSKMCCVCPEFSTASAAGDTAADSTSAELGGFDPFSTGLCSEAVSSAVGMEYKVVSSTADSMVSFGA